MFTETFFFLARRLLQCLIDKNFITKYIELYTFFLNKFFMNSIEFNNNINILFPTF